ncbi:MAG: GP88 family protein [Ilumatobacteraceae bacterium]
MANTTTTTTNTAATLAARVGAARANAPQRLPADVAGLLDAFGLTLAGMLTTSSHKAQLTTRAGVARSAMHYALPHRALARAVDVNNTGATTAPRGYIAPLRDLATARGMLNAALAHNGCMHATAGCSAACLAHSGHGGLSVAVQAARGRRTLAMLADPHTYARAMVFAVAAELQRAERDGLPLALRLNGTDESPWCTAYTFGLTAADAERLRRRFGVVVETGAILNIADAFAPERSRLRLYEYLKAPVDHWSGLRAWQASGWDVTASFAADRATACRDAVDAVRAGFRVAVPVALKRNAAPLRSVTFETTRGDVVTLPAVSGDATDARYLDAAGVAVVLREKTARGANRALADRFILPDAPAVDLADGRVLLTR